MKTNRAIFAENYFKYLIYKKALTFYKNKNIISIRRLRKSG